MPSQDFELTALKQIIMLSWGIPNLFPQSELAQISSINLALLFEKLHIIIVYSEWQVYCDSVLYALVLMF